MTLLKNKKILLVPFFACLILILKLLSPMNVFALSVQGDTPFGFMTPQEFLAIASTKVTPTDYYVITYSESGSYTNYACYFFNSDTATFQYNSQLVSGTSQGIWGRPGYSSVNIQYITSTHEMRSISTSPFSTSNALVLYNLIGAPSTYYNTVKLVATNAPIYNTDPIQTYSDDVWAYNDGYSIKFGVNATLNSMFSDTYFVSKEYTAEIDAYINGQTLTVYPSSYAYYGVGKQINIIQSEGEEDKILYMDKPYLQYWKKMRSVKVNKYEYPSTNPPTAETLTLTNSVTYNSENEVTLNTLLTAFQNEYPAQNLTIEDMQTEIVLRIKSDSKVELTKVFDYSPVQGESPLTEIPPDEEGTPNQFDPYAELNANISSNNYYLKSLLIGETYQSNGMSDLLQTVDSSKINNFEVPDIDLEDPDFDSDTLSWFRRVVEWWYSTPFGFIALAALTFLIIRAIVW